MIPGVDETGNCPGRQLASTDTGTPCSIQVLLKWCKCVFVCVCVCPITQNCLLYTGCVKYIHRETVHTARKVRTAIQLYDMIKRCLCVCVKRAEQTSAVKPQDMKSKPCYYMYFIDFASGQARGIFIYRFTVCYL